MQEIQISMRQIQGKSKIRLIFQHSTYTTSLSLAIFIYDRVITPYWNHLNLLTSSLHISK